MIGAYGEERLVQIRRLGSRIEGNLEMLNFAKREIKRLRHDIKEINKSLDADYEKLLELDPCLMR